MRLSPKSPLSFLRSVVVSLSRRQRRSILHSPLPAPPDTHQPLRSLHNLKSFSHSVEQLACASQSSESPKIWDLCNEHRGTNLVFEGGDEVTRLDLKDLSEEVELPEQRRRERVEWLCKELPTLKYGNLVRILNAQRKWITQDDSAYVVAHCTGIRGNDAAFQVYKWMMQQHWYHFDFDLATKVADYLGKERKFVKCRDIFDDMINQGRVPCESTFHVLVVAYLGASVEGCLEEACTIYNRMIQLGGYNPRLSLHNSLFRALVAKPGCASKRYLKQAELIYCNLVTTGVEVPRDIYVGLIRLHNYQEVVDEGRIMQLREEMRVLGIEEDQDVLVSILRACSKQGDVEEAEKTWLKLADFDGGIPSVAFVYRMQTFAKVGEPMKSMETFRMMQELLGSATISAYQKIIEVLCDAQRVELAELVMQELAQSGLKPLAPSYVALVKMYLNLSMDDKVESTVYLCQEKCRPNRAIYNLYLDSLLKLGNLSKAEEIFIHMQSNEAIGVDSASCNAILSRYLASGEHMKAEKVYDLMCTKRYDVESSSMEKLEYVLSLSRKVVKKPVSLKLSAEQREALVGLLLGGLQIDSDDERKNHMIRFELNDNSTTHSVLRRHLYDQYHEWLHPSCRPAEDGDDDIPYKFSTISHSYFGFYADQFWPRGRPMIPKLINRWLSPRALAYWYMYGGYKAQSGDILLKLKFDDDQSVAKVVKALRKRSLECKVKRKGQVSWIGLLGSNATWFSKLVEPYLLDGLKDLHSAETQDVNFDIDAEQLSS
ncbi:Pentatricopeptide repeat-containing protein At2g15820, chloroplastic [Linum perenne]